MIRLKNILKEALVEAPINYAEAAEPVIDKLLNNAISRSMIISAAKELRYGKDNIKTINQLEDVRYDPKRIKQVDPQIAGEILKESVSIVLKEWQDDSNDDTANQLIAFSPLFIEMSKTMRGVNPTQKKAFRGTKINDKALTAFIKKTEKSDWKDVKVGNLRYIEYIGNKKSTFTYTPKREVQSWSISNRAASRFGTAIVTYDIDETFFFTPEFLYALTKSYKFEKETIHFGKYPMKVRLLIDRGRYNDLTGASFKQSVQNESTTQNSVDDEEGTLELVF